MGRKLSPSDCWRPEVALTTSSPVDQADQFVQRLAAMERRIADLERVASRSIVTSGTYTPTLANMAIGTGGGAVNAASFTFTGPPGGIGLLTIEGNLKFGTAGATLPGAGVETFSLPTGYANVETTSLHSNASSLSCRLIGAAVNAKGIMRPESASTLRPIVYQVAGANIIIADITAAIPGAWANGDEIWWKSVQRATGP